MAVSLIALHWKRQGGKLKISIQKTDVREIVNCLHILGNEPYFQLLLFIISDLRKCPCPIRASREKWKCPIRATFCPIRASRFGVNRPNFAKRNNTSRGEVRKKWEAGWKITRQLQDYYIWDVRTVIHRSRNLLRGKASDKMSLPKNDKRHLTQLVKVNT